MKEFNDIVICRCSHSKYCSGKNGSYFNSCYVYLSKVISLPDRVRYLVNKGVLCVIVDQLNMVGNLVTLYQGNFQ